MVPSFYSLLFVSSASRHEAIGAEDLLNLFQCKCHLLVGVSGHEAEANERVVGCHSGRNDGIDKDALVQQVARDGERLVVITDEQRDDGSLGMADFTTHIAESLQCLMSDFPEVLLTLGLTDENINSLHRCGSRCGGDAGGEDIAA